MARLPKIVFIDDQDGEVRPLAGAIAQLGSSKTRVISPGELTEMDLEWADLLLVDFGLGNWPGRDAVTELARRPPDGLAVAAILRRHVERMPLKRMPPTAIAMLTGQYPELVKPLGRDVPHHIAARLNGLEWAFDKSEGRLRERIASLAVSVRSLPQRWTPNMAELLAMLGIKGKFSTRAIEDSVRECHPPIANLSTWNHGLIVLRWLLHRVLPYPTCVYSTEYLAARLGVRAESLKRHTERPTSKLRRWLEPAKYRGVLMEFDGPRWWRAEVERLVWTATQRQGKKTTSLHGVMRRLGGKSLELLEPDRHHVVCVDHLLRPSTEIKPLEDCVRIQPDDWPLFADAAWVSQVTARDDPKIASIIVGVDRTLAEQSA